MTKLLNDEQINAIVREASRNSATRRDGTTSQRIARAIEAAVLEAQGKQEPVAFGWRDVAEELPTEAQEVLFVRGDKVVHGAWIGGIFWHSNTKMAAAKWMPLPPVDLPPLFAAPVVQPGMVKDAERYRWLRDESQVSDWDKLNEAPYPNWDDIIDAMIAAAEGKE